MRRSHISGRVVLRNLHRVLGHPWIGNLSPCRDYHDYVVGNIKEHTISELWNCGPYTRFRRSLAEEGLMPVCSRCCGLMGY